MLFLKANLLEGLLQWDSLICKSYEKNTCVGGHLDHQYLKDTFGWNLISIGDCK